MQTITTKQALNIIRIINTLERLGFKSSPAHEPDAVLYVYNIPGEKLEFEIAVGGDMIFAQLTWHKDSKNFSLIPFNVLEDERQAECVALEHLETCVTPYILGTSGVRSLHTS